MSREFKGPSPNSLIVGKDLFLTRHEPNLFTCDADRRHRFQAVAHFLLWRNSAAKLITVFTIHDCP